MQINRFLIVFFLLLGGHAIAQDVIEASWVKGRVTDKFGQPIEYTHIVNLTKHLGEVTNAAGDFEIFAAPGDLVRFSCIGYNTSSRRLKGTENELGKIWRVTLSEDTVMLKTVNIFALPKDATALKEAILEMETHPLIPDLHLNDVTLYNKANPSGTREQTLPGFSSPGLTYVIPGPITALYEAFSKKAQSRRQYEAMVMADAQRQKAARRYNAEVVRRVTHIDSDEEIQDFMLYCHLDVDFVNNTSDYQLYESINQCFNFWSLHVPRIGND